jgi:hypothetical protein
LTYQHDPLSALLNPAPQISDHLSFSREDPDDVKVKEIGEILSVGDRGEDNRQGMSVVLASYHRY